MGRRAEFKDIAHGLANGFISRNNDVDGYWALGQLHALACRRGVDRLRIDLWPAPPPTHADEDVLVALLQTGYRGWIERQLRHHGLATTMLQSASIELEFGKGGAGLSCCAHLTDDIGHVYRREAFGTCRPHDPARESRSLRFNPARTSPRTPAELSPPGC